ncbi:MAG TPA: hypothetical protein VEC15_02470, partial [Actinomycetota bacterium]|nr:hypothetical protein [Actinomycetota bacterium]
MRRGDLDPAVLLEEEFLPRVRSLQRAEFWAPALSTAVLLEHRRGHHAVADDLIDEFIRVTEDHDTARLQFLPDVARVCAAHGRIDVLERLVSEEHRVRNERGRRALAAARAVLAEARGDHADAAARYADVAHGWLRYGSIPERAEAMLGRGRCLLAIGEVDEARVALAAARVHLEELGAAPALAEIDDLSSESADATASASR